TTRSFKVSSSDCAVPGPGHRPAITPAITKGDDHRPTDALHPAMTGYCTAMVRCAPPTCSTYRPGARSSTWSVVVVPLVRTVNTTPPARFQIRTGRSYADPT